MIDARFPDFSDTPASGTRPSFGYTPASTAPGQAQRDLSNRAPVVTVVTPFFNTGPIFHETARTIFAQSLTEWEWVIVNDRSSDPASLALLDHFRTLDSRIRVIDLQTNSGPGAARNAGFAAARSEFVYQLDADDLIEPTTLETLAWFLATNPQYAFASSYDVGFGTQGYLWTRGFHEPHLFAHECPVTTHAMIRKPAHTQIGGYDESIRGGMEDWEFWLHAADLGLWGATIPQFLGWYRRRDTHHESWHDWDNSTRQQAFQAKMKERFPRTTAGHMPQIAPKWHLPFEAVLRELPFTNPLAKHKPRVLLILPWMRMGGADKFNLDLTDQLIARGYEVTIASTVRGDQTWLPEFSRRTPDIFVLHDFLRPPEHPAFLRYLIDSRCPDAVVVSNSELGYACLPYLRSVCAETTFIDYVHMEEEHWKNGGFGRHSVGAQEQVDLTMVTSEYLKRWMVARGADADRIEVCYINVDPAKWAPDPGLRARVREELAIDEHTPVVLYAGRLCAQKQPAVLVETVLRLAQRDAHFRVLVAGDGEDRAFIEQSLDRHDLRQHVTMLGETTSKRMRELFSASDIFFLPSQWEGIALVLYESMASGVTFVGANVGGQTELLPPDCGVLITKPTPPDAHAEAEVYADKLAELLYDPARRAMTARAARRHVSAHFTLDRMGECFVNGLQHADQFRKTAPRVRLSPGYAHESADRAVEMTRLTELADQLWAERDQLRRAEVARASSQIEPSPTHNDVGSWTTTAAVSTELAQIQNSRSYRWIQYAKKNPVYKVIARIRFGSRWDHPDPNETDAARLHRIKQSRTYRLVMVIKSTGIYQRYSLSKHGTDHIT